MRGGGSSAIAVVLAAGVFAATAHAAPAEPAAVACDAVRTTYELPLAGWTALERAREHGHERETWSARELADGTWRVRLVVRAGRRTVRHATWHVALQLRALMADGRTVDLPDPQHVRPVDAAARQRSHLPHVDDRHGPIAVPVSLVRLTEAGRTDVAVAATDAVDPAVLRLRRISPLAVLRGIGWAKRHRLDGRMRSTHVSRRAHVWLGSVATSLRALAARVGEKPFPRAVIEWRRPAVRSTRLLDQAADALVVLPAPPGTTR